MLQLIVSYIACIEHTLPILVPHIARQLDRGRASCRVALVLSCQGCYADETCRSMNLLRCAVLAQE